MARPWKLQEMTYKEVREGRYEVAVLPIGATEPHGLHLPYGTDAFESEGIAERVCEAAYQQGARVILLPNIPYGVDSNMRQLPLAIDVRQTTLDRIVSDIVASLEGHGIGKLVLFNGHGGNDFKPLLRELYGRTRVFVVLVDWWQVGADVKDQIFATNGDHADEMETSVSLALAGHLVRLAEAGDGSTRETRFEAINKGWVDITRPWHLFTIDTGSGDPRKGSAQKGERYIQVIVERLAPFLKELSDAELDERFPFTV